VFYAIGESRAWETLGKMSPGDICRRALCEYNKTASEYRVRSFGQSMAVNPANRTITAGGPGGKWLLEDKALMYRLSALCYLLTAKDVPVSGELKTPAAFKAGEIYRTGTHVLPLKKVAERYVARFDDFVACCKRLGGEVVSHGDAAVRLYPFPRVPVVGVLWNGDDEFPPRADLLFDSSCPQQLAPDIIWAVASLTCQVFIKA